MNTTTSTVKKAISAILASMILLGVMGTAASAADRIENLTTTYPQVYQTGVKAQGSSGGTVTLSTSRTHSHTISGSIGISVSVVQASIGYEYNISETVTYSYSRSATSSAYCYYIYAYDNFRRDNFKWIDDIWLLPDITGWATTQDHRSVSYRTGSYVKPSTGC
ncbi:MAG: hypothetical protein OEM40_10150 [Acidimicrobiia bacterium]|nr:hypothetical protein [Acidimicrobiia bacterium]